MDDIRPPRQTNQPVQGYNRPQSGFQQTNQQTTTPQDMTQHQAYPESQYNLSPSINKPKKSKLKVFFVVLMLILLIISLVFSAYQYMQISEYKEDIKDLNNDISRMVQQINSLEYDNTDLNNKLKAQQTKYQQLAETSVQLKAACGNACKDINIVQ
jgi:cell division protein FtsB